MTVGVPRSPGVIGAASTEPRDRFASPGHASIRYVAQRGLLKPLIWTLTNVTVIGRERLRDVKGPFVVVANHSSHLDTPLIFGALPRRLARYLAAGAAADYFFDVWWRRGLTALFFNAFPVRRSTPSAHSVSARSLLLRGIPLLIFPEGTRSRDGEFGAFKPGAAALAASCEVPCIPLALIGVHIAHPRGTNWPRPGRPRVGIVFGEPLYALPDEGAAQFSARLRAEITRLRDTNTAIVLGQPTAPKGVRP
ncbi:1-acyl-sn-glycerol-3-phosphate acyltransferase [Glaciihabitans tibetensis]|uniref:1-acyl-sn-glycerol-3-phosphate acyltransferase n=1 Tax=Glaciihabitans tibetensis TaxID=1266600 RepID=A0A2T0VA90_9MICO|nr:lysophospholipid acyltransferase family protein [Glaciihabitans tibetensis]PRY67115.1 1-acyl-sn-glycerol-3-phosphate acyltransferase [Glaciihabitans tibetensis]